MKLSLSTARFAAVLAVAAVVFGAGLVSGAAGQPLIMGSLTNSAGGATTRLSSNVNGSAYVVIQSGAGVNANGIQSSASAGTGGVFTSSTNNALFATAASGNRFAMVAVSNGGAGTGGALLADGNANPALDIQTNSNVPPMTVNQQALVTNLVADETDHWDVGCPGGTVWAGGLCLETSARSASTVYEAGDTCAALGSNILLGGRGQQWMLPTALQLRGAHNNDNITLTSGGEWSGDLFVSDADGFRSIVAHPFGELTLLLDDDAGADHVFRCGAVPLSFDGLSIITLSNSPDSGLPAAGDAEGVYRGPANNDGSPIE